MGSGSSSEEQLFSATNRQIEQQLHKDKEAMMTLVKVLLLGPGECGKSTILKQMRILQGEGFSDKDFMLQRSIVRTNAMEAITTLLTAMETLDIPFADFEREGDAMLVKESYAKDPEMSNMSAELCDSIKRLWADHGVRTCFARSCEFQLIDSAQYFLDNVGRISLPNYQPSRTDVLMARKTTCGIVEISFELKGKPFLVVDVGGQRTQRRKWIHCFECVSSILYIAAVSEYNQLMRESPENRLIDAIRLFGSLANSRWFRKTHMILFLNKIDLFRQKVRNVPITACFPDYGGTSEFEESINYIEDRFLSKNRSKARNIYVHRTCATDCDQMQHVLNSVVDMVIENNLQSLGLS